MHGWRRRWECASTVSGDGGEAEKQMIPPAPLFPHSPPTRSCLCCRCVLQPRRGRPSGGNGRKPKCNHLRPPPRAGAGVFADSAQRSQGGGAKSPRGGGNKFGSPRAPITPLPNHNGGFMHETFILKCFGGQQRRKSGRRFKVYAAPGVVLFSWLPTVQRWRN